MVYVCDLEGEISLDGTEVDSHRWFAVSELQNADISFPSLRSALSLYVAQQDSEVPIG
jgi:hypothetical protein